MSRPESAPEETSSDEISSDEISSYVTSSDEESDEEQAALERARLLEVVKVATKIMKEGNEKIAQWEKCKELDQASETLNTEQKEQVNDLETSEVRQKENEALEAKRKKLIERIVALNAKSEELLKTAEGRQTIMKELQEIVEYDEELKKEQDQEIEALKAKHDKMIQDSEAVKAKYKEENEALKAKRDKMIQKMERQKAENKELKKLHYKGCPECLRYVDMMNMLKSTFQSHLKEHNKTSMTSKHVEICKETSTNLEESDTDEVHFKRCHECGRFIEKSRLQSHLKAHNKASMTSGHMETPKETNIM